MDCQLEQALQSPELFSSFLSKAAITPATCSKLIQVSWVTQVAEEPRWLHQLELLSGLILNTLPSFSVELVSCLVRSLLLSSHSEVPSALSIGTRTFNSANELKHIVFDLMQKYAVGAKLSSEDQSFMLSLLAHHPKAEEKLANFSHLIVAKHDADSRVTKCFSVVSTDGQVKEISYVKSVAGLVTKTATLASSKHSEHLIKAAQQVTQFLVKVIASRPLLQGIIVDEVGLLLQRKGSWNLPCFYKCVLEMTLKLPGLCRALWEKLIEKLVEFDCEDETAEVDALLTLVLEHINSHVSLDLFRLLMPSFTKLILPTFETKYSQLVLWALLNTSLSDIQEEFVSAMINNLYACFNVTASAAYLVSFLSSIETGVTTEASLYLAKFIRNALKKQQMRHDANVVTKYLFHLIYKRPALLENKDLVRQVARLVKSQHLKLSKSPCSNGPLLTFVTVVEESRHDPLYLPFMQDVSALKLSLVHLHGDLAEKPKRRRGFSFDCSTASKRHRSMSLDESMLREVEVSSLETNA
eukprot:CAMPEP_0204899560 /NCGR_PEP_ID=MMETSP1397-20131031/1924_1 /ASSEMBLY_ACC=CAM_ASM_000891 /TAXON_ID=49980 /ORGANISM="Climacostomum Climacostomum virens, Strain Stock W-24" /LENGTH=525 /DNA_ID=CAMNT_0052067533 /DNA_START=498 /DNA_END=2071 /DNA_ORIENTATION=+